MSFSEHRRTLTDEAFGVFGVAAIWGGVAATVRVRTGDRDERYSGLSLVGPVTMLSVRSWEIAAPVEGDIVAVIEGPATGTYRVSDLPMLRTNGAWECRAEQTGGV